MDIKYFINKKVKDLACVECKIIPFTPYFKIDDEKNQIFCKQCCNDGQILKY